MYSLKRARAILTLLFGLSAFACGQELVIPVWPGVAPGSETWTQKEVEYANAQGAKMVRNIVRPTLTAFLPEKSKSNGTAIVVCPGGGFRFLSWQSEGTEVAQWLQARGVAAFVLKYRVVDTGATEKEFQKAMADFWEKLKRGDTEGVHAGVSELAGADGRQAIKVVRQHAGEWGILPDRIGILGFSAGGMVTMQAALQHDAESRPNFAAPIYGAAPTGASAPADAGPIFILCASDDPLVPPAASQQIYSMWRAAGHPAELHIYSKGGHGFGMNKQGLPVDRWIEVFGEWLGMRGWLKR